MSTLGVDPGLKGALAVLDSLGVHVFDMPTRKIKDRPRLDHKRLHEMLGEIVAIHEPALAVVEDVQAMPTVSRNPIDGTIKVLRGATSTFTFGNVAGATLALIESHKITTHLVSPRTWKRVMGLSADKGASRALASRLFPKFAHLWARKKDDGRAEAALLAYYGSRLT